MTPKDLAWACADVMWGEDRASQWIGMTLDDVDAGWAEMSLTVQKQHCNGLDICHGGVIFALADSAFAFACNSRNQRTVAQHNVISFIAPGKAADQLRAEATEVSSTGRSGIYDVRVTNQDGKVIAEMRGFSRAIGGSFVEDKRSDP